MAGSTYGHGDYHSDARTAHQQRFKTPEDRSQKPIKPESRSWWLVPKEQFSAEAKDQLPRMIGESGGTVIRVNDQGSQW